MMYWYLYAHVIARKYTDKTLQKIDLCSKHTKPREYFLIGLLK